MGLAARSYDHPRWSYDETLSPAARRSAARAAARAPRSARVARPESDDMRRAGTARPDHGARTEHERERQPRARTEQAPAHQVSLRVVRQPRGHFGSIVLVVAALGLALLFQAGLNGAIRQSQYRIAELQQLQDDLIAERSSLRAEHATLTSTSQVKDTADRLGMVTPADLGFIHLEQAVAASDAGPAVSVSMASDTSDSLVVALASQEIDPGR